MFLTSLKKGAKVIMTPIRRMLDGPKIAQQMMGRRWMAMVRLSVALAVILSAGLLVYSVRADVTGAALVDVDEPTTEVVGDLGVEETETARIGEDEMMRLATLLWDAADDRQRGLEEQRRRAEERARNEAAQSGTQAVQPSQPERPVARAPLAPQSITIPGIGVVNMITVGLTSYGAVDVPTNIWQSGWFNGSAMPGNRGAAFIVGHTPGIFTGLRNLNVGDVITVTMNNGQQFNYRVVLRETVHLHSVDMRRALSVHGGGVEGLNLMTCTGTFVPAFGTYDHRIIVYTVRI